jgi:predicted nuclease of predicted toxin-antitoxin system
MRVLLDNCIPWKLSRHIIGHEVASVIKVGWDRLPDGQLLDVMASSHDVLVTMDKNSPFQQRVSDRPFGIIVMRARGSRLKDLLPLIPNLHAALEDIRPGEVREITS